MESPLDSYEDVVLVYVSLISQDSPQAGAAIEQIQTSIGTQAALRAALIITVLRMEVRQNHWVPDISVYAYLIRAYPQAVPLLEYAVGCCLQVWGIHNLKPISPMNEPANTDTEAPQGRPRQE
jgi:hypothetical protein